MGGAAPPTRPGRSTGSRDKNSPNTGLPAALREKTRPARPKTPKLECFECAGRTISRLRDETPPQGELFAHSTHTQGDDETNNTTAQPQHGTTETGITSAPENCTKNAYFSPAKAMAVSIPHRYQRAQAITVSNHRTTWPTRPGCGACGRWRGLAGRPAGGQCYKRRHTNAIHIATLGLLLQTSSI